MIPLWKPSIGTKERECINLVLNQGYLGHGSFSDEFESICCTILGVERSNILSCSTGHAALHLIINTICSEDSVVASPTFNNIADFQAIINNKCVPLLLDSSDPLTPYVSPKELRDCFQNNNVDAFIALDYASNLCPLEEYYSICKNFGVKLIYDAAHSFGSINACRLQFCDAAMFSFDPIKTFTCIDGGLIYFKNKEMVPLAKPKRFIGMQQNESKIKMNQRTWEYDCSQEGWRYHLSNIHAAVGISQIKRKIEIEEKRKYATQYMRELFAKDVSEINFYQWDQSIIPFMNVAIVKPEDKTNLRLYLEKNNIQSGTHWKPGHLFTRFSSYKFKSCDNANQFYEKAISLPLFTDIEVNQINHIHKVIKGFFAEQD